jgi:hypothetical protein
VSYTPEEITLPEAITTPTTSLTTTQSKPRTVVGNAEYLAYFNTYSPYAVAGERQAAEASAPVARTSDGWKVFGVAWYVWVIAALAISGIILSVRRSILRKHSVLSVRR